MQRYFVHESFDEQDRLVINGEDVHHISKVMRMDIDDELIVVVDEMSYIAKIVQIDSDRIVVSKQDQLHENKELPVSVTIAFGLLKGEKMDWLVQKATELGVTNFQPFVAERSVVKWDEKKRAKKIERLQKISKEAAEQSHRSSIPKVHDILTFRQLLESSVKYDNLFVADEEEAKGIDRVSFQSKLKNVQLGQSILLVFGPEGGLTRNEVNHMLDQQFSTISLGPRILRAETAPLYALASISYEFE